MMKTWKNKPRFYSVWLNMKSRCTNPNYPYFHRYGGRGIAVCLEWSNSFPEFSRWCHEQNPAKDMTLERMDNNKGYSPSNCLFASRKEQANNRHTSVSVKYKGENLPLVDFLRRHCIVSLSTFNYRRNQGWSIIKAATSPSRKRAKQIGVCPACDSLFKIHVRAKADGSLRFQKFCSAPCSIKRREAS